MSFEKALASTKGTNRVILHLLQQGMSLDEIIELTIDDIDESGIKGIAIPDEIAVDLGKHLDKNENKFMENNILFPGRKSPKMAKQNILINLRGAIKKADLKLSDIGLSISNPKKPVGLPKNNMHDITNYIKYLKAVKEQIKEGKTQSAATKQKK